jgi:hypothetical protein
MEPTSGQAKDVRTSVVGGVRQRVLAEHERLRIVIAEVDRCAAAMASGRKELAKKLRRKANNLFQMLARHIDHEVAPRPLALGSHRGGVRRMTIHAGCPNEAGLAECEVLPGDVRTGAART